MEWLPNISASSLIAWDVHFLEAVGAIPGKVSSMLNILDMFQDTLSDSSKIDIAQTARWKYRGRIKSREQ